LARRGSGCKARGAARGGYHGQAVQRRRRPSPCQPLRDRADFPSCGVVASLLGHYPTSSAPPCLRGNLPRSRPRGILRQAPEQAPPHCRSAVCRPIWLRPKQPDHLRARGREGPPGSVSPRSRDASRAPVSTSVASRSSACQSVRLVFSAAATLFSTALSSAASTRSMPFRYPLRDDSASPEESRMVSAGTISIGKAKLLHQIPHHEAAADSPSSQTPQQRAEPC